MILYNGCKWIFQQISTDFNWRSSGFPGHPNAKRHFFLEHPPPERCPLVESFGSIHGKTGTNTWGNLMNLELGGWDISHGKKCFLMSHYTIPHSPILESWYTGDGEFRIVTLNSDCKWFSEWIKEWTAKEQTNERMNEWMKQQKSWVNQFVNDWMKNAGLSERMNDSTSEWMKDT